MIVSVLTVTARPFDVSILARALAAQVFSDKRVRKEWVIVDSAWPEKEGALKAVHNDLLNDWRIAYAPVGDNWCLRNGYRFLAHARNTSLLMAGYQSANTVVCCPIDDDLVPISQSYLETLYLGVLDHKLYVPPISFGPNKVVRYPSGNAATPFRLSEVLELNGYDELLDANWPGTSTYEDVDLCFRMKTWDWAIVPGPESTVLKDLGSMDQKDPVRKLNGIKCNHVVRIAGSYANWVPNGGANPAIITKAWEGTCPELSSTNQCNFLGRKCELPLENARFGADEAQLKGFLGSRPKREMPQEWVEAGKIRRGYTLCHPLGLDLIEFRR